MRRGLLIVLMLAAVSCGPDDGRQLAEPDPDLTAVPVPSSTTGAAFTGGEIPVQAVGPDGLTLQSPDFVPGGALPRRSACGGERSPALRWSQPGDDIVELALVAQDADADFLAQWVVTGMPAAAGRVPAGGAPIGAEVRLNSAGGIGWDSPCPADGRSHQIVFTLYALDQPLAVGGPDAASVVRAVQDASAGSASIVAQALPPGPEGG